MSENKKFIILVILAALGIWYLSNKANECDDIGGTYLYREGICIDIKRLR